MAVKNMINDDSVGKYFDSVFGFESKHATVDQFYQHILSVEQNDKNTDPGKVGSLATLYRHAGMMILEHENSVKAQEILEKSVKLIVRNC